MMHHSKRSFRVSFFLLSLMASFLSNEEFVKESLAAAGVAVPQRIVSLAPSVTEILFALSLEDRLVGVTTFCDYPVGALRVPKIGSFIKPSIEAILAKRPDLVVGVSGTTDQETVKQIERSGLRVLIVPANNLRDIFHSIRLLAKVTGREERGAELSSQVQRQMDRVKERIARAERRRVLMIVGVRPLVAVGRGSYIDELLTLAGGSNIVQETSQPWVRLPTEYVVAKAPQVIIEGVMGSKQSSPGQNWNDLKSIPAVKEGRLYSYPSDKVLRPGPRVGEALEELAHLIHPECFARLKKENSCAAS